MIKRIKEYDGAYIADNAVVCGDVTLGEDTSVWYSAVVRGDEDKITIGSRTNIQDNCTLHCDKGYPLSLGDDVTVGHGCVLHGCEIGDRTLIGMGAVVLNGARLGKDCMVGAGALVTGKMDAPDGSLIVGSPAKIKRELTEEEKAANMENVRIYIECAREHFGNTEKRF